MSYEPTNWKDGDLVTSAKLNKLEQGVASAGGSGGGGILVVHQDGSYVLDKTWQEINDADFCVLKGDLTQIGHDWMIATAAWYDGGGYKVTFNDTQYLTDTPDGYPLRNSGK